MVEHPVFLFLGWVVSETDFRYYHSILMSVEKKVIEVLRLHVPIQPVQAWLKFWLSTDGAKLFKQQTLSMSNHFLSKACKLAIITCMHQPKKFCCKCSIMSFMLFKQSQK